MLHRCHAHESAYTRYTPCAFPSYAKAGWEAEGSARGAVFDCPVGVHILETVGAARKRRTEPPTSGGARSVVLVLYLAVSSGIIGVLRLLTRLVRVCSRNAPENLKLREEEKVILCRRDRTRGCAIISRIVRVLGNGL